MKVWFTVLLICLGLPLIPLAVSSYRKKEKLLQLLSLMMFVVFFMNVMYLLYLYLPGETGSLFCVGVYHVCYLWLLYAFFRFAFYYSESREIPLVLRIFVMAVSLVDLYALSVNNVRLHHAITFVEETYRDGLTYRTLQFHAPVYWAHLIFTAAIAVFAAIIILYRFFTTQNIYRRRYGILMMLFVTMVGLYALLAPYDLPLHTILIPFNLLCYALHYAIGHYIPRDLMYHIMSYAASSIEEGIVCFDNHNSLLFANMKARDILRFTGVEKDAEAYFNLLTEQRGLQDAEAARWSDSVTDGDETRFFDYRFQRIRDDAGMFIGSYFTAQDRTSAHRQLENERTRATRDPLTGLYNTEGFIERVSEILREDMDTPRFMLASDIKDFKLVNDLFGIEKGNEILIHIAELLSKVEYKNTVCGRLSGDHFVMLVNQAEFQEGKLLKGIEEICSLVQSTSYKLCIHVGVFAIDDPMMSVPLMYDRARMAIATVKNENRSRVVYFSPQILRDFMDERRIVAELDQAIRKEELMIYLQPQIDADNVVSGAEALVRWNHPVQGLLMPGAFIPVLEQAGMIHQLDLAVWEMTCKQLRDWKGTPMERLYLSVNISARDFYYIDVYHSLTHLADAYNIDPSKLHLEITESALISDPDKQQSLINRLRSFGFEVEIDDFGSGYSSLSMLKDFPVDTLKLDLAFLRETENKMRARVILASVISLTNLLGMRVIAEGVEDQSQLDYLKTLGCGRFQGYFFSRPVPVEGFEAYFKASCS